MTKIALISMPWSLFNRPSIQLGTLKAFIESRDDDYHVDTYHPYLEVASILGPSMYHWISQNPWVSESLYAPLLFPEQTTAAKALAHKYVRRADDNVKQYFQYESLCAQLGRQLQRWVKSCDWSHYTVVGFSICFHQLFASLTAAREIKKKHPNITIVFGGSSCCGDAGRSLLNTFHSIDYVIEGEGEMGLMTLVGHLTGQRQNSLPENIFSRQITKGANVFQDNHYASLQTPSLGDLPVPDYNEYFSEQRKWFPHAPFIPILPIEFSRGCWWNKCSFCNLNLQWCGYRFKKAAKMMWEVKTLVARHDCLDFTFVDNMLPPKEAMQFFAMTARQHSDLNFFAEIRSARNNKSPAEIFATYRQGGLTTIQVGIEALSSSLLQKMKKGVSVIENIATMRGALENNLKVEGNLILHFPGSSKAEVDETLEALDFVFPFSPLTAASFFLGHGSPIYWEPHKYGIRTIVNHANNRKLFPKYILPQISLLIKDYRGDRLHQRKIWQPVVLKIKKWHKFHENRKQSGLQKPLLFYRDGGDFLLVRQELTDGKILHHRLKNTSRRIYLFCTHIRTEKEICDKFPAVPSQKILTFLTDLMKKKILFSEKNKYLALAVHFRG